ncbi:MAG: ABC transporter permease [Gammaproteobacteria bacterium]|nr:ABC transporter permease [Gammaproteobacteria bacterium]
MAPFQFALSWRLALRHFIKSPASYLYGAVALALGLGSATLLFSLVQGLTAPLPVPNGEHVLRVVVVDPIRGHAHVTIDDFHAWRMHAGSFESIAAVAVSERRVGTRRGDFPARVAHTTADMFPLLGVEPMLGRWPAEADGTTIAIGEDLWATTFEGDPAVLGRAVRLDNEVAIVVGVMPSGFRFPRKQDIWQVVAADSPRLANGEVVSRLKHGVSRMAASQEFTELMQAARTDREGVPATATARLIGFTEERGDRAEHAIGIALLLVVLGLVLLSCSNVSALLLERNLARTRTLALHQALGARPAQIALQTLVEALLIGGLGGILGAAVAHVGLLFLTTTLADNLTYFWTRLELDVASVAFAGALSLVVAVLCGALPAWRAVRTDAGRTLAEQAQAIHGSRRTPVSWVLVNAQMAFAVAVVVAAVGLATILVQKPWEIDLTAEFSGERVVAAQIAFEDDAIVANGSRVEVLERMLERVRAFPGVQSATVSMGDWLASRARSFGLRRVAFGDEPFGDDRGVPILYITPGFIDTFAINLVEGRPFDARDTGSDAGSADVAIVTEEFVRARLPDQASVGRRFRLDQGGGRERAFRKAASCRTWP